MFFSKWVSYFLFSLLQGSANTIYSRKIQTFLPSLENGVSLWCVMTSLFYADILNDKSVQLSVCKLLFFSQC